MKVSLKEVPAYRPGTLRFRGERICLRAFNVLTIFAKFVRHSDQLKGGIYVEHPSLHERPPAVERTMRLMRTIRIVGMALGVLAGGLSSSAWAQTRLSEAGEQDRWAFAPGRIELGAQTGGGFSLADRTREATEFAFLPRIGYVFAQQEYFLPGSFEIVAEPTFLTMFQHEAVYVGGLAALLKYNFRTGTHWTPYLIGGGGVSFASHRLPHGGTNFNFMPEGGLGLQYALSPRSLLGVEWRFQHFSNADISPPNPSLNMSLFFLGYSVLY